MQQSQVGTESRHFELLYLKFFLSPELQEIDSSVQRESY